MPGGCPECGQKDILVEQLQSELKGKSLQIGNLKREVRDLRAVEPMAEDITTVLQYAREVWGCRWSIVPGSKRWEKIRARLKEKPDNRDPFTVDELSLAANSAVRDEWLNGSDPKSPGYLKVETVYRDFEQVERLLAQLRCDCGHRNDEHEPVPDEFGWRACSVCECAGFTDVGQQIEDAIWRAEA